MFAFLRRAPYALMVLLALAIATFSYRYLLPDIPAGAPPVIANRFATPFLPLHAGLAATALLIGPFQFWAGRNGGRAAWHRVTGALYMLACLLGAPAGFMLALGTTAGPVATAGFGLLAVAWFWTTGQGLLAVIGRRYGEHRRWMIRSFALTYAAVMLRLYLPLSNALGLDMGVAYLAISWLCWVPNLLLAEQLFVRLRPVSPSLRPA